MVALSPISTLYFGLAWESDRLEFRDDDGPVSLSGRTLVADWREHNTQTVLLSVSTSGGGIVVDNAASGYAHFELTAAEVDDLNVPGTEVYPGARRRFDVRIYDSSDNQFVVDTEITART